MRRPLAGLAFAAILTLPATTQSEPIALPATAKYAWKPDHSAKNSLANRIPPPPGAHRLAVLPGHFSEWLRHIPVQPGNPPVLLHNGRKKPNQSVHTHVLDIDVGKRDLQQCADAVMRLRAEHLFSQKLTTAIHFNFTSGDRADYLSWAQGQRPVITGNRVAWQKSQSRDASYSNFRKYMNCVFTYAGTASLSKELIQRKPDDPIVAGDVFIRGGFPGHAVIVMDTAVQGNTYYFLLAQSYMPAQSIHIPKNPKRADGSPWYQMPTGTKLVTPEWTFKTSERMRFAEPESE